MSLFRGKILSHKGHPTTLAGPGGMCFPPPLFRPVSPHSGQALLPMCGSLCLFPACCNPARSLSPASLFFLFDAMARAAMSFPEREPRPTRDYANPLFRPMSSPRVAREVFPPFFSPPEAGNLMTKNLSGRVFPQRAPAYLFLPP